MNEIDIHVQVEVNPTEDLEKVKMAVENIFGAVKFDVESRTWGNLLIAETSGTEGLTKLYNLLSREKIRAAARKVFLNGITEKSVTFCLNKQVAYAGHISFCQQTGESPLGPIRVQIRCNNPRELIEWLTPKSPKRRPSSRSRLNL